MKKTTTKKGAKKQAPTPQGGAPLEYLINPETGQPDPMMGVKYDWAAICREYKKLGCPEELFDPTTLPWGKVHYMHEVSPRGVGKTTCLLLFYLCAVKLYPGSKIAYIRQRAQMIERRQLNKLFDVIKAYDYISKLTDGKYNSVDYYARQWYYVLLDDDGKVLEKCPWTFMDCFDIDEWATYKSTYNGPRTDFLLFDEMLGRIRDYRDGEFVDFCQIVSTICRLRLSPTVVTLSNAIDIYSPYLKEFGIQKTFANLQEGSGTFVKTAKGTVQWCEYIGVKNKVRPVVNSAFYGFDNPLLTSITGGSWAIEPYPHIWRDETRQVIQKGICLVYQENVLELELCICESIGLHVCVHSLRKLPSNPLIIYTLDPPRSAKEVYGFGPKESPISRLIWYKLYPEAKWHFASDEEGQIVDHFYNQA